MTKFVRSPGESTVPVQLDRMGIERPSFRKIKPDRLDEAIRLYHEGRTL